MKRTAVSLFAVLFAVTMLSACSSSSTSDDDGGGTITSGIRVVGSVEGLSASISNEGINSLVIKATHDADPDCPTTDQANSFTATPSAYVVKLKRLTLLGSTLTGTSNHDLINVTNVADATEVDFTTTTTFVSSENYPPAGTYDGIEIEVFYIGETVPMVIPAVNADNGVDNFTAANYLTRGYFAEVGNIDPRDVTVFVDDDTGTTAEYWINRQTDIADPYSLEAVTGTHPFQVLDLWSDANFWCEDGEETVAGCTIGWRDPMSICTRATSDCDPELFGADFRFSMADGSDSLVIPDSATGLYTITFTFDVNSKFTFWGDVNYSNPTTEAYGTFRVGYDCGYRIMFPDVSISISE